MSELLKRARERLARAEHEVAFWQELVASLEQSERTMVAGELRVETPTGPATIRGAIDATSLVRLESGARKNAVMPVVGFKVPETFMGMPVKVDETMPPDRVELRQGGKLAGAILNIGTEVGKTDETMYVPTSSPRPRRLLVLSCSATKTDAPGAVPAIDRYDGPAYRTLRAWLRENPEEARDLKILIISAKFGAIPSDTPIEQYDLRMDRFNAHKLQGGVRRAIKNAVKETAPLESVLVVAGSDYLEAIGTLEGLGLPYDTTIASGGIGQKLGVLRRWLHKEGEHAPSK